MSETLFTPRALRALLVVACVGVATLVAYAAFLGWDQSKDTAPDGSQTGPYQPWQVVGSTLIVVLAVAYGAWRGHPIGSAAIATFVYATVWTIDAAPTTPEEEPSFYLVGAFFVFWAAAFGLGAVAAITWWIRRSVIRRSPHGQHAAT